MHIENDDDENLFSLLFQTLPVNSNGVAHILEHTVLCGSKKFPIKDPFFSMNRRSMNTFMNAMTGADFTCYPASSQIEKDFYNLLEVYLDAVFYPLLTKESFLQEGHRLEFEDFKNSKTPLKFKGVVYNEMKGAMSSPDSRLWHSLLEKLVPNLPYAYNSGGEPHEIPNLTYQELLDFHKIFYHPSHCLFFFYGNIPLEKHLDFLEKNVLEGVSKISLLPPISSQKRFTAPYFAEDSYPVFSNDDLENKSMFSIGWLTCFAADQKEMLALSLLDQILMATDASVLKKALLKSKLCHQAESYLDSEMSEIPWIIICKGFHKKNEKKLSKLIFETLEKLAKEKISKKSIESALHQMELSRTEITGDSYPYGLSLFMRCTLTKQHGCSAENSLKIHSLFKKLRRDVSNPNYLPSLIRKYFLKNSHFVQLMMHPSTSLLEEEEKKEKKILEEMKDDLSENKKKEIVQVSIDLDHYQEKMEKQSVECLPKIALTDIPKKIKDFPLLQSKVKDLEVFHHDCFTNQLVYVDLYFDLPQLEKEDLSYCSLFNMLFTELGCGSRSYQSTLEYLHAYTGGVEANLSLHIQSDDYNRQRPSFSISGKALYRNSEKLFSILKDFLCKPRFDEKERIAEVLKQTYTCLESRLASNAMQYAVNTSYSEISSPSFVHNQWHGLPYFHLLQKIVKNMDHELPLFIEKMLQLKEKLLTFSNLHLVISCDRKHFESIQKNNFYNLATLSSKKTPQWEGNYKLKPFQSKGYILSSPVAFTCSAYRTVGFSHPESPNLLIATKLMDNLVLHHEIREIGGAYGSGASYSPTSGNFYFFGFRDPHITNTLSAFKKAVKKIAAKKFNDQELEEAKLGILQNMDTPISPGSRGLTEYLRARSGKTKQMRQKFKDRILLSKPKELAEAVEKNLLAPLDNNVVVSFSGKELLEKESKKLSQPKMEIFSI